MNEKRRDDRKSVGDEDQTITAPTPPQGQVSIPADEEFEEAPRRPTPDGDKA
jgi:hypothetical protein